MILKSNKIHFHPVSISIARLVQTSRYFSHFALEKIECGFDRKVHTSSRSAIKNIH